MNSWISTDTVDEDTLAPDENPEEKFGTIMFEWRYWPSIIGSGYLWMLEFFSLI